MINEPIGGFMPPARRVGGLLGDLTRMQTDAFSIVLALGEVNTTTYSERELSGLSGVPRRTMRRYIKSPHLERVTSEQLGYLRKRIEWAAETPAWTATLVESYYAQVIANANVLAHEGEGTMWLANTSLFPFLVEIGARYDWRVYLDEMGLPRAHQEPKGYTPLPSEAPLEGYL